MKPISVKCFGVLVLFSGLLATVSSQLDFGSTGPVAVKHSLPPAPKPVVLNPHHVDSYISHKIPTPTVPPAYHTLHHDPHHVDPHHHDPHHHDPHHHDPHHVIQGIHETLAHHVDHVDHHHHHEVQQALRPVPQSVCTLKADPGYCNLIVGRWYYDFRYHRCLPFLYTGCGGNTNNFVSPTVCDAATKHCLIPTPHPHHAPPPPPPPPKKPTVHVPLTHVSHYSQNPPTVIITG